MTVEPLARYYFVPVVREGLASFITADGKAAPERERALIQARLTPVLDCDDCGGDVVPMKIALFGPGDVLGFDPLVVTRTDPKANIWDYEPNFMPLVELSEPDLPWRFTPDLAPDDGTGKLMPWITLIVLKDNEYGGVDERLPDNKDAHGLPIRWIKDVQKAALPDLDTAYLWAHVHLTNSTDLGDSTVDLEALQSAVRDHLSADPETHDSHIVARLVCPRRLEPKTHYTAFVIPTFKIGQVAAGLVSALTATESALTPGWNKTDTTTPPTIDLPYYYRFEFGTSVKGDFEYLVRLLEPRPLPKLGKRAMNCSDLQYDLPDCPGRLTSENKDVLDLEGALRSPDIEPGVWRNAGDAVQAFRTNLGGILNLAAQRAEPGGENTDAADPKVVPPIFGRRHAQQFRVTSANDGPWLEEVNLDPRLRAAAGYAAQVVEKDQEALMVSVWDQLGNIEDANQAMAHGQLGLEASKKLYGRLNTLSLPDFLWTSAPAFNRVPFAGSGTVSNHLNQSPIPPAAFDAAFRRVLRRGGAIRKRQQRSQQPPPAGRDLLSRLNARDTSAAGPPPNPPGIPSMCDITEAAVSKLEQESAPARRSSKKFRIRGRVIDRWSRRGVAKVRVEAWDKDPFFTDLLGSAVTNERGTFLLEFDESYYRDWILDPLPDVFFKVLRRDESLSVVAPPLRRDLPAGDSSVVIEVDQAPGSHTDLPFRIKGQVIDRATRHGIAWLRVEAWDKDFMADDLVGGAVTDATGAFTITLSTSYFKEWFLDHRPDLYFKVFRGPELLANTAHDVKKNVKPGDILVTVEIPAPASLPAQPGSGVADFCEAAVTCDNVRAAIANNPALGLHAGAADAICDGIRGWLELKEPQDARPSVDLTAVRDTVRAAIAPWVTIPARLLTRVTLGPGVHQRQELGRLESEIDFPQPMYEPLAAISQDLILPGVETVPQNTISILQTNRRFTEAYMLGINDAVISECVWRGAPVYVWSTCTRQFWDVRGLVEPGTESDTTKDITRIATWTRQSELGRHDPRAASDTDVIDRAVLLVRGDVLKRYPNTLVYAVAVGDCGKPALAEYQNGVEGQRIWPIFSGSLAPDLTFLGFNLTPEELCRGGPGNKGYYIVLEERLGEPRFGFDLLEHEDDVPEQLRGNTWWYDMTWAHLQPAANEGDYIDNRSFAQASTLSPSWGRSAAIMANIALQRPVRMAVHASKMLSREVCQPPQVETCPQT